MIVPKLDVGNREALVLGVFGEGKNMEEETRGEKAFMEIMWKNFV